MEIQAKVPATYDYNTYSDTKKLTKKKKKKKKYFIVTTITTTTIIKAIIMLRNIIKKKTKHQQALHSRRSTARSVGLKNAYGNVIERRYTYVRCL